MAANIKTSTRHQPLASSPQIFDMRCRFANVIYVYCAYKGISYNNEQFD